LADSQLAGIIYSQTKSLIRSW